MNSAKVPRTARAIPHRERLEGGVWGCLIGDACGVPYEFHAPDQIPPAAQIDLYPPVGFVRSHRECAEYAQAQPMPGLLYADPPYLGTWAGYRSGWGPSHTAQVARLAREHGHSAVHDTDAAATIHEGANTVEFAHVYRVGKSKRGTSKEVLYVYES